MASFQDLKIMESLKKALDVADVGLRGGVPPYNLYRTMTSPAAGDELMRKAILPHYGAVQEQKEYMKGTSSNTGKDKGININVNTNPATNSTTSAAKDNSDDYTIEEVPDVPPQIVPQQNNPITDMQGSNGIDMETLLRMSQPSLATSIGRALQGAGAGMRGQTLVPPENDMQKLIVGQAAKSILPDYVSPLEKMKTMSEIQKNMASANKASKFSGKTLTANQMQGINSTEQAINNLEDILKMVKSGKIAQGLSYRFSTLPGADIFRGAKATPDEQRFVSTMQDMINAYMTAQTGAQRGFKEIQWLGAALPQWTDLQNMPGFIAKTEEALRRMKRNRQEVLKKASLAGYNSENLINNLIEESGLSPEDIYSE